MAATPSPPSWRRVSSCPSSTEALTQKSPRLDFESGGSWLLGWEETEQFRRFAAA